MTTTEPTLAEARAKLLRERKQRCSQFCYHQFTQPHSYLILGESTGDSRAIITRSQLMQVAKLALNGEALLTESTWRMVSKQLLIASEVVYDRIDIQASSSMISSMGTSYHELIDGTLAHPSGGFYWVPRAHSNISLSTVTNLDVLRWMNFIGGVHSDAGHLPITVPAKVTGFTVTVTGNMFALAWKAPYDGESPITGYKLEFSPDGTTWLVLVDDVGLVLNYSLTGPSGLTQSFRVSAINAIGTGEASNPVSGAGE